MISPLRKFTPNFSNMRGTSFIFHPGRPPLLLAGIIFFAMRLDVFNGKPVSVTISFINASGTSFTLYIGPLIGSLFLFFLLLNILPLLMFLAFILFLFRSFINDKKYDFF